METCLFTTLMFCLENNSANSMHNQQNEKCTQINYFVLKSNKSNRIFKYYYILTCNQFMKVFHELFLREYVL